MWHSSDMTGNRDECLEVREVLNVKAKPNGETFQKEWRGNIKEGSVNPYKN